MTAPTKHPTMTAVRTEPLPPTVEGRPVDDEVGDAEADTPLSGCELVDAPVLAWEVGAPLLAWEVGAALFGWEVDVPLSGLGVGEVDVPLPGWEVGIPSSACTRK